MEYNKLFDVLKKEDINIKNLLRSIKKISLTLDKEDPYTYKEVITELAKVESINTKIRLDDEIKESINEYIILIKTKINYFKDELRDKFGYYLDNELKKHGQILSGNVPLLKVLYYTIEIKKMNDKVIIWYGPSKERLANTNLYDNVAKKIMIINDKIVGREFNEKDFLKRLFSIYEEGIKRHNKQMGDDMPIIFFLDELGKIIEKYDRVLFSYDLYQLKERSIYNRELIFRGATMAYTIKRKDFLWIPSNDRGDGDYISHIKFKEVIK